VDCREAELGPGGVDGEQAGWEASEAGGLATPDVVLDGSVSAVADEELGRAAAGVRGVGEEDLVPQALVALLPGPQASLPVSFLSQNTSSRHAPSA
jgi:hypothetical protein